MIRPHSGHLTIPAPLPSLDFQPSFRKLGFFSQWNTELVARFEDALPKQVDFPFDLVAV
jgi:hypothetical protein